MGLFGVHMPLLYGEGRQAFLRLQLEIMKVSDDESLFAWTVTPDDHLSSLLAVSPMAFWDAGNVICIGERAQATAPYSMTNKGISISLALISKTEALEKGVQVDNDPDMPMDGFSEVFAPLNCGISSSSKSDPLQILLRLLQRTDDTGSRSYYCSGVSRLPTLPLSAIQNSSQREQILIFSKTTKLTIESPMRPNSQFTIQAKQLFHMGYAALAVNTRINTETLEVIEDGAIHRSPHVEVGPEGVFMYNGIKIGRERALRDFIEFKGPRGPDGLLEAFVLQIDYTWWLQGMTGITFLLPGGSSIDELDRLISDAKNRPCSPCDRASIVLPSGCQVYAAFRKWI